MPASPLFRLSSLAAQPAVPSPCISVCKMDPRTGWCEGCSRTIDEIAAWSRLDDQGKRAILAQLGARRHRAAGEPA